MDASSSQADKPKRRWLKFLRIGFSGLCGIVCMLLVMLWVRSYWWLDGATTGFDKPAELHVASFRGDVIVSYGEIIADDWSWIATPKADAGIYNRKSLAESWEVPTFGGMGATIATSRITIAFPYWMPVLVTSVMTGFAVLPWLSWRFSLRTLLIAMTLVAVLLGAGAWAVK